MNQAVDKEEIIIQRTFNGKKLSERISKVESVDTLVTICGEQVYKSRLKYSSRQDDYYLSNKIIMKILNHYLMPKDKPQGGGNICGNRSKSFRLRVYRWFKSLLFKVDRQI